MFNPAEPRAGPGLAIGEVTAGSAPARRNPVHPVDSGDSIFDDLEPVADTEPAVEWTEEDVVFLHWRLLQELEGLSDPTTPLETQLDTLRWVFTEVDKDHLPFSFANCLAVVGNSPLSPIAYCGRVDADEVREHLRCHVKGWLAASLQRYPDWVRDAVTLNPDWVEEQLSRNPQWINEQLKTMTRQGDLFA